MTSPFLQKAETNRKSARLLLDAGDTDSARTRASYAAMYDAARACLAWAGVAPERGEFETHIGTTMRPEVPVNRTITCGPGRRCAITTLNVERRAPISCPIEGEFDPSGRRRNGPSSSVRRGRSDHCSMPSLRKKIRFRRRAFSISLSNDIAMNIMFSPSR